jgi:hypothetical protein
VDRHHWSQALTVAGGGQRFGLSGLFRLQLQRIRTQPRPYSPAILSAIVGTLCMEDLADCHGEHPFVMGAHDGVVSVVRICERQRACV